MKMIHEGILLLYYYYDAYNRVLEKKIITFMFFLFLLLRLLTFFLFKPRYYREKVTSPYDYSLLGLLLHLQSHYFYNGRPHLASTHNANEICCFSPSLPLHYHLTTARFLISSFLSSVFPPLFVKHFTNLITVNCGSSEEVRLPDSGRLETFTILKSIWLNWKYLVFLNKSDEVVLICQQEAGARSRKSGRPPRMQQLTHTSSNPKE